MDELRKTRVVVIGAGVIGLSTAVLLQSNGYEVTIVASHFPSDELDPKLNAQYTSPL